MVQFIQTIWHWVLGINVADVSMALLALWAWREWVSARARNWFYKRPAWAFLLWLFAPAIAIALLTDRFYRWGQQHPEGYRVALLLVGLAGTMASVAGIWISDDLLQLGLVLFFLFVLLFLWERDVEIPISRRGKQEEKGATK